MAARASFTDRGYGLRRKPSLGPEVAQAAGPVGPAHGPLPRWLHLVQAQPARARRDVRLATAELERAVLRAATAGHRCAQHAEPLPAEGRPCTGIRVHRADPAPERL